MEDLTIDVVSDVTAAAQGEVTAVVVLAVPL